MCYVTLDVERMRAKFSFPVTQDEFMLRTERKRAVWPNLSLNFQTFRYLKQQQKLGCSKMVVLCFVFKRQSRVLDKIFNSNGFFL